MGGRQGCVEPKIDVSVLVLSYRYIGVVCPEFNKKLIVVAIIVWVISSEFIDVEFYVVDCYALEQG